MSELSEKLARLQEVTARRSLDGLRLSKAANVAWLSGGARAYVDASTEQAIASLLVLPSGRYVVADDIEAPRLRDEEPLGDFRLVSHPWHEPEREVARLTAGLRIGSDLPRAGEEDVSEDLVAARAPLLPDEIERYRALCRDVGAAMNEVASLVQRGMSEHRVAGLVGRAVLDVGAYPVVVLAAADERIARYRHPLPTDAPVQRALLWVVCARRHGLVANASRMLCFGGKDADLARKARAVARVEAAAIAATRPGVPLRDVFARIQQSYAEEGFPDAWRGHHQGGACSYGARDFVVVPDTDEVVRAPQAYAWNPSVPGAKSEDTILCTDDGVEILTASPGWPSILVDVDGRRIARNDVLER